MITEETHISAEQWEFVKGLINDVVRDAMRDQFVGRLFQWDLAVKQFRKVELQRVILRAPDARDLDFHAFCLHALLAIGMSLKIQSESFTTEDLSKLQVSHEQIAAYVEDLEQSLREWHHGFSPREVTKVQKKIFGEAA